jgi:hypothetical protein
MELTDEVGAENGTYHVPAGTSTVAGTWTRLLDDESVTLDPPEGALAVKYTVPAAGVPPVIVSGLMPIVFSSNGAAGTTVSDPVPELEL